MIVSSSSSGLSSRRVACRSILPLVVWTAIGLTWTHSASGQLDVTRLIGYAVDEPGPQHSDVAEAITRFRNRDLAGARDFLKRAREKSPELPVVEVLLAKMHYAGKQPAAGRAALERAVATNPGDPEAFLIFADLALNEGQITEADLLFERAFQVNQALQGAELRKRTYLLRCLGGLALVAERRENWPAAVKHLKAWAKADPEKAAVYQRLGRALFMDNDARNAYDAFTRAHQLDSVRMSFPDIIIALLYHQQGNEEKAKQFMDRGIKADGNNVDTRVAHAQWMLENNRIDEAIKQLDGVLEEDSGSAKAALLRGVAARLQKDYATAERQLKHAHLLAPGDAEIPNQLALVLVEDDDDEKLRLAVQYATLAARQNNKKADARVTLAWIYFRLGRTQEAEQVLSESLQKGTLSADSRYIVAQMLFDKGRNETAKQLLEAAMSARGIFVNRQGAQALLNKINQ